MITDTPRTPTMREHNTLDQLRALKLHGCANALEEQMRQPNIHAMSFEERLALLVDREVNLRSERKQTRLLQSAQLKFPRAAIEDFDNRTGRGIERKAFMSLALSPWITRGDTILLTGATGVGKSWLACALAQYACRRGHSALYLRVPRLAEQLRVLHSSGGFGKWLVQLANTEVLILDDWGVASLDPSTRSDLLEIIDDRAAHKATVITTQLPIDHWHAWIGDATIADAILDRVLQQVHRVELAGESLRKPAASTNAMKAPAKDRGATSAH
jgi:DNA replication protein DnaC